MAFIPTDEEDNKESGMNVFSQDGQAGAQPPQQGQQDQSGQPANISGAQTTIPQGGQSQAPLSPAPKKAKGSGMFTNTRKYIDANKPSASRLGGAVASKIQQAPVGLNKQLQQQKQNIAQRYQAQQRALGQTGQAVGQATQTAQNLVDPNQLKAQQSRLQTRIGALGELQQGGYTDNITGAQSAYEAFAPQVEQAQGAFGTAQTAFQEAQTAQQQAQNQYQDFLKQQGYTTTQGGQGQFLDDQRLTNLRQSQNPFINQYDQYQQQINQAQEAFNLAQAEQQTQQQALDALLGQQTTAQQELQNFQNLQKKYERQQELMGDISNIESQLSSGQETLDPQAMGQVRDFLTGQQKFEVGNLDTRGAEQKVKDLLQQSRDLGSRADVRKKLLRETFGGDYTRGASKLDELILARTGQLGRLQDASRQTSQDVLGTVQEAREERGQTAQQLADEVRGAREETTGTIQSQLEKIRSDLQQRALEGETGRLGELYEAFQSPEGLSQEQLERIGGSRKIYDLDLGQVMKDVLKEQQLGLGDVASSTERARVEALNQLLGKQSDIQFDTREGDYTRGENQVLEGIKQRIGQRQQEYKQKESAIRNQVTQIDEWAAPIANQLLEIARTGQNPTDEQLAKISSDNYWSWAGRGQHGISVNPNKIRHMINTIRPQVQQLDESFNVKGQALQAFQPQQDVAKDGLIKRNALRRLLGSK